MIEKTLKSGRKVLIKDMSLDDIDECKDTIDIEFSNGQAKHIRNVNKSRTKWLRKGIAGGDFKNWKPNLELEAPDAVIKQLSDTEKEELHGLIQEAQSLGEDMPSNLK